MGLGAGDTATVRSGEGPDPAGGLLCSAGWSAATGPWLTDGVCMECADWGGNPGRAGSRAPCGIDATGTAVGEGPPSWDWAQGGGGCSAFTCGGLNCGGGGGGCEAPPSTGGRTFVPSSGVYRPGLVGAKGEGGALCKLRTGLEVESLKSLQKQEGMELGLDRDLTALVAGGQAGLLSAHSTKVEDLSEQVIGTAADR